jgi:hypothetical protein
MTTSVTREARRGAGDPSGEVPAPEHTSSTRPIQLFAPRDPQVPEPLIRLTAERRKRIGAAFGAGADQLPVDVEIESGSIVVGDDVLPLGKQDRRHSDVAQVARQIGRPVLDDELVVERCSASAEMPLAEEVIRRGPGSVVVDPHRVRERLSVVELEVLVRTDLHSAPAVEQERVAEHAGLVVDRSLFGSVVPADDIRHVVIARPVRNQAASSR